MSCFFLAALFFSCSSETQKEQEIDSEYVASLMEWRQNRESKLRAEEGYLSLAGFHWLEEGSYVLGDMGSADIVFPDGSTNGSFGKLLVESDSIAFFMDESEDTKKRLSVNDSPIEKITVNRTKFYVIKRNEKMALRIEWLDAPSRSDFTSIEYFNIDTSFTIPAKFELYDEGKPIRVGNVKEYVSDEVSHGDLIFELFGEDYRLQSMNDPDEGKYFVIFSDETNSETTYGGGRFMWVEGPDSDGNTVIDFNRAYNPPCAFTKFSTCPIPPEQNRLRGSIEAGERKYEHTTS